MAKEVEKLKVAIIAGASHAAKYIAKNQGSTESEIVKEVAKQSDSILHQIDKELR